MSEVTCTSEGCSSHVAAPVGAGVQAVGRQGGGRARAGANGSGRLRVADLRDHVVGLPALHLLPHEPLHLLPVDVCVPAQTLVLKQVHDDD